MIIPIKKTRVSPRTIVALLVSLVACLTIVSLAYAELGNISPDADDSINTDTGETGKMNHLLKDEGTSKVKKTRLGVYYNSGPSGSSKHIEIQWGIDGKRCVISNEQIQANPNGGVKVEIIGQDTKTYYVPIKKICDQSNPSHHNSGGGDYGSRGGNNFVGSYAMPDKLLSDVLTGGYRVTVNVILDVNSNSGNGLHFGFRVKAPGAKVGILRNNNAQEFGVLASDAAAPGMPSPRHGIKYRAQFGIPCTEDVEHNTTRRLTVYDPDPEVFGNVYVYVTKRGAGTSVAPTTLDKGEYIGVDNTKLKWEGNLPGGQKRFQILETVRSGDNVSFEIGPVHHDTEYKLVIVNTTTPKRDNPADNVLSVGLPGDAIYGDLATCEDTQGDPFVPIIKVREEVVEPSDDDPYHVQGHVKTGSVEVAPGREAPKVPVQLHRAIYNPDQATFGGGSNTDGPSRPYYNSPVVYDSVDGSADMTAPPPKDYWYPQPAHNWHEEVFRPDFREKDGSTTCFILAVQQPPTVKQWTYQYQVYLGDDKDGNPIYATYSATNYWYSDEDYTTPSGALSYYHYDKVERTWVHAVDCVTVGKRPKVQILGNDSRVRGDSKTKLTRYGSGGSSLYFGSWIEYGALSTKIDDAPASGAGYRNGTTVDVSSRIAWSRLTFANVNSGNPDTFGEYTSLPAPPNIAGYYDERSRDASALTSDSLTEVASGTYRTGDTTVKASSIEKGKTVILYSTGTVTISDNITYDSANLTSLSEIPQVIIIAKNINILKNVGRIDAWLIADGNGNSTAGKIDTCSDGPSTEARYSKDCNVVLEINGPVIADALYLNRTGPDRYDAAAPAEVFRLRPDAYLWAASRQRSTGAARTVDIVELPPRF